jgi:hypothetical protein
MAAMPAPAGKAGTTCPAADFEVAAAAEDLRLEISTTYTTSRHPVDR